MGGKIVKIPSNIEAISLDIWGTLLRGNKKFTLARLKLICEMLGLNPGIVNDQLIETYLISSVHFDKKMEVTGRDFGLVPRLTMALDMIGVGVPIIADELATSIQLALGRLRCQPKYQPSLIEPSLLETLAKLKDAGIKLALLSNTGADSHESMKLVLETLGIWKCVDLAIFSSEDGRAKPNPGIFHRVAQELGVRPDQILHIGDNPVADYQGAIGAGCRSLLYAPVYREDDGATVS
jgi:putative hydrolase of the HAD superfamily